jgi:hypothetical protein
VRAVEGGQLGGQAQQLAGAVASRTKPRDTPACSSIAARARPTSARIDSARREQLLTRRGTSTRPRSCA